MVRILRHYIHRQTLCHISLDLSLLGLLLLAAFLYSSAATHFAHPVLLLGAALMATGVSALRVRPVARPRVLVYGCGPQAMQVGRLLQSASPRVNLVGYYAGQTPGHLATTHAATAQPNLFCSGTSLAELARKERIQQIVVAACKHPHDTQALGELLDCRQRGLQVLDLAAHFEHTLGQIRHDAVSTRWLVRGEGFVHSHLRSCTCQLLDLVGASLLLLLALPVMLLAAVLIRLESGGPVFYRQERVGLHGRTFNMLKFRSMRTDAEPDGRARWASPGDARVTRVGRFLRKRRRAAPTSQCAAWPHEPGGAAPGAALLCPHTGAKAAPLRPAPQRQAGYHRVGAGALSLRRLGGRCGAETAVRPVLRQEPVPAAGLGHSV
jgi:Bacterial sugar transferase